MFEFIRNHKRLMQFLLMLLIIPSFAFFGLEGYQEFGDKANVIAKVAGKPITQQEMDAAQQESMERFRQMLGQQFDPSMFNTPEARKSILDNLITQRALAAEAGKKHLWVSDQTLQKHIMNIEGLTGPDGQFDVERYKMILASQGLTPLMYQSRLRQDLTLQQVGNAIPSTAFIPQQVLNRLLEFSAQEREIQSITFKPDSYSAQVKTTEEQLKAYYEQHKEQFAIPEQVKAEYIVLDMASVESQITVSDADIKTYYEQNKHRYSTEEQRRASHILVTVPKKATPEEKANSKTKAEGLLARVRSKEDFAKVAKENSQDPISAEQGGDLGFFSKGMMVKPFEDATFKMKEGEISGLVESEFGFHIIKVTGTKPSAVRSLDEVKNEIGTEIKRQLATKKFSETADIFANTVYEQADSLKPAADKLNLKIQVAANLKRATGPTQPNTPPTQHPKFLQALFADDAIKNKHNTEAIETAPSTLISGHVIEHTPAATRPFAEVKESIRAQVIKQEALRMAKEAGQTKLTALKKNGDANGFSSAQAVSRQKPSNLDNAALMEIMKVDASKLPVYVGVEKPNESYTIYRINKVMQPAKADLTARQAEQRQMEAGLAQQEMTAYIDAVKERAGVKLIHQEKAKTE